MRFQNRKYPGKYRIVLFEDQPEVLPKPVWKGTAGNANNVAIFLNGGHFDAIKKIACFFNLTKNYCVDCECAYQHATKHTMHCKTRCPQCTKGHFIDD